MRYTCSSLLCSFLLLLWSSDLTAQLPHLDTAKSYLGVKERGNNRGDLIDRWNRAVRAPLGSPWCASYVSWCCTSGRVERPGVRSAWSRAFIVSYSIPANKVLTGEYTPQAGDIVIWRRSATAGHIGFVSQTWTRKAAKGWTIEGNTSSSSKGSQWNGGEVAQKWRSVNPFNHFRITHFTPVFYGSGR